MQALNNQQENHRIRTFTVVEVSNRHGVVKGETNLGGKYKNYAPVDAAKKAASKICSMSKIHGRCVLMITIQEITPGSKQKTYTYKITRSRINVPVERNGIPITFKYEVTAKSMNV